MVTVPQDLLLDVYAHVRDPQRWHAVLDRVCADLGVRSAVVQRVSVGTDGRVATKWLVRDGYSEENGALHDAVVGDEVNPRMQLQHLPPDLYAKPVLRDEDFIGLRGASGRRFREALDSIGLGDFLSSGAPLPNGDGLVVVLHRRAGDRQGFNAATQDYTCQLARHLRQALLLRDALEEERRRGQALGALVDRMRFGVLLCDAAGRVLWMNGRAQTLLARHTALVVRNGRITGGSAQDATLVQQLMRVASETGDGTRFDTCCATIGAAHGEPLHCLAVPLAQDATQPSAGPLRGEGRVALLIGAPGAVPRLDPEAVERLLGLSPTEARLAVAICEGMSLKCYARARGVAEGTARFQLKQVLAKTGATRQADLVRLVFSSVVTEVIAARTA